MSYTTMYLDQVRTDIAPADAVLAEARTRLTLVKGLAETFPGARRTYSSGSLAHLTVNDPVSDGDGGLVLDRRSYPALGPDGDGEQPQDVVDDLCALLGPTLREVYPAARCHKSKRGPKILFGAAVEGQDPTVDLVVALTRKDAPGIWIPNLELNTWEPSHPETHSVLIASGTTSLVRKRREVIRLAKAWNKQYAVPAFSSFHLSVLALSAVTSGVNTASALQQFFETSAAAVALGATPDPAEVSADIVPLIDRSTASARLEKAADALASALADDEDEAAVQTALSSVFWKYIDDPTSGQLSAVVSTLQARKPITTSTVGLAGNAVVLPSTRAYGDGRQ